MFIQTGVTVFNAIFQLFLISLLAGILVKKKFIAKPEIKVLSGITVNVFLPSMILSKILMRFKPEEITNWWILLLAGFLIILVGILFSAILFGFKHEKRPLMALSGMQNGLYIVLPIGQILFPDQFDLFAIYGFILIIGLNVLMWSLGKVMISGDKESKIHWKDFVTPPIIAMFISMFLIFTHLSSFVPVTVISAMDLLGQGTIPLAVFILGATIGTMSFKKMPPLKDVLVVTLVKFVLLPLTVFAALYYGGFQSTMPLFCSMMIIQASSPPATNLILVVENYGGDSQAISSMMLIQYMICIVAMPLWIAAWQFFVVS